MAGWDDPNSWEYSTHPRHNEILAAQSGALLLRLTADVRERVTGACDTRAWHRELFADLAPPTHPHYAGNYRGSDLDGLRLYRVQILGASHSCLPPEAVGGAMKALSDLTDRLMAALDAFIKRDDVDEEKCKDALVCLGLPLNETFLAIHPYANGNGHVYRLLWFAMACQTNLRITAWSVHPRPGGSYVQVSELWNAGAEGLAVTLFRSRLKR